MSGPQPVANGPAVATLVRALVVMALVTFGALVAAVLALSKTISQEHLTFSIDAKGVVTPRVPLSEAYLSESRVVAFAEECIRRAFAHDFLHYERTLALATDCFTPDAGDQYVQSLAPFIKVMTERRMVMGAVIDRVPRVVQYTNVPTAKGMVPQWRIEAVASVHFEGRAERIPAARQRLELVIRRVPLESSPRGVQIDSLFVRPM